MSIPAQARRIHIEMYREEMKQQGLHVTTRSHKLSIVRRFYDAAVQAGLRETNPAAGVRGGKDQTPGEEKIKCLTAAALSHLLEVVPTDTLVGLRDRAIIALMAIHGLRRVEVERLDENSLYINEDLVSLEVRGKGNRMRQVYLRPDTYAALGDYLKSKHRNGLTGGGACFVSLSNRSRGQRISQALAQRDRGLLPQSILAQASRRFVSRTTSHLWHPRRERWRPGRTSARRAGTR